MTKRDRFTDTGPPVKILKPPKEANEPEGGEADAVARGFAPRTRFGRRWWADPFVPPENRHGDHDQSSHGNRDGGSFDDKVTGASSGQDALNAAPAAVGSPPTTIETRGLTESQIAACDEYRSFFGYRAMNGGLRGGELDERAAEHVRNLDDAMASSPLSEDAVVYRGIRDGDVVFGDQLGGDLTGATWTDPAFTSTSVTESVAVNFSRRGVGSGTEPVAMRIVVPEGTGAIQLADLEGAGEMALERGLGMRVAADHGVVDGVRRLDVEIVR